MRVKITKQGIEDAAGAVWDIPVTLWDVELRGFGVRIGPKNAKYPQGKISYLVQKRMGGRGSREIRFAFGEYPSLDLKDARNSALALISDIRAKVDLAAQRKGAFQQRRDEAEASKTKR